MSSTRDRLERLFSTPGPGRTRRSPENDPLARLEKEMLEGQAGDAELSVKERLERLVAVAASRPRTAPRREETPVERRVVDLDRALPDGQVVENEHGAFFAVERALPLECRHGRVELNRLTQVPREAFAVLARGLSDVEIDLERALFVDTETTGLAGGSGTYAFLIGLGFVREGAFVVRQLFMRDYREEPAMLRELSGIASRYDLLVSYNGKSFDVPLLETRFVLSRQAFTFEDKLHFDLLHPARSLWKARFESCRLAELESVLLGFEREDDVPGHLIPDIYFRFVRTGDASRLPYVFEHNVHDVLSLAALTVSASEMLDEDNTPSDPIDDVSLGKLFERVSEHERSIQHYTRAVEAGVQGVARRRSLRGLAELHKRKGDFAKAKSLWQELAEEPGAESVLALHELAVHLEHREKNFDAALSYCERGLERLEGRLEVPPGFRERWRESFVYRKRRLTRRAEGKSPESPNGELF